MMFILNRVCRVTGVCLCVTYIVWSLGPCARKVMDEAVMVLGVKVPCSV